MKGMTSNRARWLTAWLMAVGLGACSSADPGAAGSTDGGFAGSGETAGGKAAGGSASGGSASGGKAAAGATSAGGSSAAGSGAGGIGNAGTPSGGAASGGSATGGSASGGSATGGSSATPNVSTGAPAPRAVGYGRNATGGGNASPKTVSSFAELQAAIDAYDGGGLVLKYTGKFDFSSISDPCVQHTRSAQTVQIKNKSDITILGDDGSSGNFGFHIASASSNLIIRNMTLGLTPGGGDSDIISIEGMSGGVPKDIWIDHNELFTSLADCPGAGDTAFDGMIDVKKGADNITVSYNYLHDHHKVSLNGFSDSDDQVRHITFDHNLFENVGSRVPLQRNGYSHVLNNYFLNVSTSGINVRMGGYALVEANYFEKVKNPVTSRDSDDIGFWELRANNLASAADVGAGNSFGITWSDGNEGTVNATGWTTSAKFPIALGYDYTAQPFQCIREGLRRAAGAGKGLVTLECD